MRPLMRDEVADVPPLCHLRKRANVFKEYVTKVESKKLTHIYERLEMSLNEYLDLKQQLINEGWQCDSINQTGSLCI